jgi:hypothetical protein
MSAEGTLILKGKSGGPYEFSVYKLNTLFAEVGGLYLFTKAVGNSHTFIYLGHTQDLSSRFTNHHKEKCIDNHGGTHVSVCVIKKETERVAAEKDLLASYNFLCNEVNN